MSSVIFEVSSINDFYVYAWYVIETGEVFYIGKGHRGRCNSKSKRNRIFNKYINSYQCESMIIKNNMFEEDAYKLEKKLIDEYKIKGQAKANIVRGIDTNPWNEEFRRDFIKTMTKVNRERCATEKFKEQARINMTNRYKDIKEREKQSKKAHNYWDKKDNQQKQSELLKEYYKNNPEHSKKIAKKNMKPCILKFNNEIIEFNSRKELEMYIKEQFGVGLYRPTLTRLLKTQEPYKAFHKHHKVLDGLIVSYKNITKM